MTDDKQKLDAAFDAVYSAMKQANAKLPIEARCPFCDQVLGAEGTPVGAPTQWRIHCPCGKCNTILKGL